MSGKGAGNAGGDLVQKSLIPGAITMPQEQHYFLKEQAFTQSQRFTFAATEVKWFYLDPNGYTPGDTQTLGRIIFQVPGVFAAAGPIEIDFYTSPTLGAAVATPLALPSFNRVAGSAITAQLVLSSLDVAPTSLGTPLSQLLVPSNSTGVGQQSGSSIVEELPFALDLSTPILMTLKNLDGAGTLVGVRHGWFEI